MNVTIVLKQPYPHGMACTNRAHFYAKGLQTAGHNVQILIPLPLEDHSSKKIKNYDIEGSFDGVPFKYFSPSTQRSTSFLKRRIYDLIGPLRASWKVVTNSQKVDVVILISSDLYHIFLFKIVSLITRSSYIREKNEFPNVFKEHQSFSIIRGLNTLSLKYLFDGILVISQSLHSYLADKVRKSTKFLLIPILVDTNEIKPNKNNTSSRYLAYSGNLSDFKDGVMTLLKAFSQVRNQYPDLKLIIIGQGSESDAKKVNSFIADSGLENSVSITGYVERNELISYLENADALVLAKPDNQQAVFCFPSKLGEYLATGKPVVTSKIGEIKEYLHHNENAYLAQPGDADDFAKKIIMALSDTEKSDDIGIKGRATAIKHFDFVSQGKRLSDFLIQVRNKSEQAEANHRKLSKV